MDGMHHFLVTDDAGVVYRMRLLDGELAKVGDLAGINSLTWDWRGRLLLWRPGRVVG